MTTPASQKGFTLVEVMIALFIVATSLAALLQLSSVVASSSISSRDRMVGLYVLENYLSEKRIENKVSSVSAGSSSEVYSWQNESYTIRESRSKTKNNFIVKVDLEVLDSNGKSLGKMFTYYVANTRRR